jgi:CBS domain-containing protein
MKHNESVTKIMSRNVVSVHHGDPISKVRQLIKEQGVHHVPVVRGDQLVGLISYSDILRVSFGDAFNADERAVDATLDHTMTLEQIMATDVTTLTEHSTIREAAEILAQGKFHSLPVLSGRKLVGMVTSTDLIRYLVEQF